MSSEHIQQSIWSHANMALALHVIHLRLEHGWSIKQIATHTELTTERIKSILAWEEARRG